MLVILQPNIDERSKEYIETWKYLIDLPDIQLKTHIVEGELQKLTEIYLIRDTSKLDRELIAALPAVEQGIKISEDYRGSLADTKTVIERLVLITTGSISGSGQPRNIFAGLCAVDTRENVELMMKALWEHGLSCTRMGAYKPRTNSYSFQGHGKSCLPYVFELAGNATLKSSLWN